MQPPADPVDSILLRELAVAGATGPVAVVDDETGALTAGVAGLLPGSEVRATADSLRDEQAVAEATADLPGVRMVDGLGPDLLTDVRSVVLRLPKSLAALDELAESVARWAHPLVQLFGGGRVKHMSRGMNTVLAAHFATVRASLGAQKSRVLIAASPLPGVGPRYPLTRTDADTGLVVCAHGGAFAGADIDLGTRFLLGFAEQWPSSTRRVVDLGCGTGLLAVAAAGRLPEARVLALDESRAAARSAAATARGNGLADRVEVRRTHLATGVEDGSVDLVLCNPPFHRGNSRDSATAFEMLADAGRVLRLGGELWTVYNSHLPYLRALRRLVGRTAVVGQNPSYSVTRSVRSP